MFILYYKRVRCVRGSEVDFDRQKFYNQKFFCDGILRRVKVLVSRRKSGKLLKVRCVGPDLRD